MFISIIVIYIKFKWDSLKRDDDPNDSDGSTSSMNYSKLRKNYNPKRSMQYLLTFESENKEPPPDYHSYRGSFEIPFQTKKYQDWVSHIE